MSIEPDLIYYDEVPRKGGKVDAFLKKRFGKWRIWSNQHSAWWAPNSLGYTTKREKAGIYSYEEAIEIVRGADHPARDIPDEAMVPA